MAQETPIAPPRLHRVIRQDNFFPTEAENMMWQFYCSNASKINGATLHIVVNIIILPFCVYSSYAVLCVSLVIDYKLCVV